MRSQLTQKALQPARGAALLLLGMVAGTAASGCQRTGTAGSASPTSGPSPPAPYAVQPSAAWGQPAPTWGPSPSYWGQPQTAGGAPPPAAGQVALTPNRQQAVSFATAQQGKPYCWGGTGPSCFDCSGLVTAAWRAAGRELPRSSEQMRDRLPHVPLSDAVEGDVLWRPGHVGLYVGAGWAIHAPSTGKTVTFEPAARYEIALRP